jgi:LPS-assembly lipoprotein
MDEIDIAPMANREGQVMHQALEAALQRDGAPGFYRYRLAVQYGVSVQIIGVQQDSSNTRNRFLATAHWELTTEGNIAKPLAHGDAQAMDAANIIDNQYFATTLDGDVLQRHLTREVANQIATEIAIYFRAHPDHGA